MRKLRWDWDIPKIILGWGGLALLYWVDWRILIGVVMWSVYIYMDNVEYESYK